MRKVFSFLNSKHVEEEITDDVFEDGFYKIMSYFLQGWVYLGKSPHVLLNSWAKQPYCHFFLLKRLGKSWISFGVWEGAVGSGPKQLGWYSEQRMVIGARPRVKSHPCPVLTATLVLICIRQTAICTWRGFHVTSVRADAWYLLGACEYFSPVFLGSCRGGSEGLRVFPVPFEAGLKQGLESVCCLGREANSHVREQMISPRSSGDKARTFGSRA